MIEFERDPVGMVGRIPQVSPGRLDTASAEFKAFILAMELWIADAKDALNQFRYEIKSGLGIDLSA